MLLQNPNRKCIMSRNIPLIQFAAKRIGERLDEVELPLPTQKELEEMLEEAILDWSLYASRPH